MPLYFAYGSNMDVEAMARRCPRAKPLGLARLARHQLAIMREGWLTAARDPRGDVHGVLWDVAFADMRALDQYEAARQRALCEGAAAGDRRTRREDRRWSISAPIPGPASPQADYIAGVLAAARNWRLPAATIARLESFAAAAGVARSAPPANADRAWPTRASALRHAVRPEVIGRSSKTPSATASTSAPRRPKSSCRRGRACSRRRTASARSARRVPPAPRPGRCGRRARRGTASRP